MRGTTMFPQIYIPENITVPGVRPGGAAIQLDFLPDGNNVEAIHIAVSEETYHRLKSENCQQGYSVELSTEEYAEIPTILPKAASKHGKPTNQSR